MDTTATIDLAQLRGRKKQDVQAVEVRALRPSDLALLEVERNIAPRPIQRLRDRHHAIARLVAQGLNNTQISLITGMDPSRISVLKGDPTFKELVADYHKIEDGLLADFSERAGVLTLTAMDNIQEALEDPENPVPLTTQIEIVKTFADRTGHGPVQKTSNLNVNVDLGQRLENARRRVKVPLITEVK